MAFGGCKYSIEFINPAPGAIFHGTVICSKVYQSS